MKRGRIYKYGFYKIKGKFIYEIKVYKIELVVIYLVIYLKY